MMCHSRFFDNGDQGIDFGSWLKKVCSIGLLLMWPGCTSFSVVLRFGDFELAVRGLSLRRVLSLAQDPTCSKTSCAL